MARPSLNSRLAQAFGATLDGELEDILADEIRALNLLFELQSAHMPADDAALLHKAYQLVGKNIKGVNEARRLAELLANGDLEGIRKVVDGM